MAALDRAAPLDCSYSVHISTVRCNSGSTLYLTISFFIVPSTWMIWSESNTACIAHQEVGAVILHHAHAARLIGVGYELHGRLAGGDAFVADAAGRRLL